MIKRDLYKYIGRNGFLISEIILDGANYAPMYRLVAEDGKILTNGEITTKSVDVYIEDLEKWKEIDDGQ